MEETSKHTDLTEEQKFIALAKQDRKHFSFLYEKYFSMLFGFVYKRVSDKDLAADITSTVFLKAMLSIKKYEDRGFPFSSWLFRIAVNEVNMHYRKAAKNLHVSIGERELEDLGSEIQGGVSEVSQSLLVKGLNALPFELSNLIDMRFFEKRSFKEMGEILGMTEANAKVKLYRAIKKLKNVITSQKG